MKVKDGLSFGLRVIRALVKLFLVIATIYMVLAASKKLRNPPIVTSHYFTTTERGKVTLARRLNCFSHFNSFPTVAEFHFDAKALVL